MKRIYTICRVAEEGAAHQAGDQGPLHTTKLILGHD
jgi:hypothetical protein